MIHYPPGSIAILCMKIVAMATSSLASLIMGLNEQTTNFGGYTIHASYTLSSAFKYFVGGNAAAAVYCALSLPFELNQEKHVIIYMLDLLTTCLVISATSAATAISIVGKYGNNEVGWTQICQYYNSFCNKVSLAVGLSYAGFISLVAMCAYSYNVQKKRQLNSNP